MLKKIKPKKKIKKIPIMRLKERHPKRKEKKMKTSRHKKALW